MYNIYIEEKKKFQNVKKDTKKWVKHKKKIDGKNIKLIV